jgi:hypothetical protein
LEILRELKRGHKMRTVFSHPHTKLVSCLLACLLLFYRYLFPFCLANQR